jgi:2-methylcitrate dehydratase PrpD
MRHALSLVATRASGLKSQFGTMGKPFNAGIAASNGVEAALLASRGMISCADGLGGAQGFIDTHASESFEDRAWATPLSEKFLFEDNMYKLHACCHGTHAMINALNEGRRQAGIDAQNVELIALRTNPRWLKVCDIKEPRTGLEAKFSYALLAAMTLAGVDTAADRSYTDGICKDPRLNALAARVVVEGDAQVSDTQANVTIVRNDGGKVELHHDLAVPAKLSDLERGLRQKALALLGDDRSQMLWSTIAEIDSRRAKDIAALLAA